MNIVIFGNTNNYPLLLAEGLIELGHNVKLILNRKELLHRPESKHPEWKKSYPSWIYDCSEIDEIDIASGTPKINKVKKLLSRNIDLAILNDTGPALIDFLKAPHIVFLTGSDLAYYANFNSLKEMTSIWSSEFKRSINGRHYIRNMTNFIARQREGILSAQIVCYGHRGLVPTGDELLDDIGVVDEQRMMLYLSNVKILASKAAPTNQQLRILCGSRIVFNTKKHTSFSALDFKGTDLLIKGFSGYCQLGGKGTLILPKKGQDLNEAKQLINKLEITHQVNWLPELSLLDFYEEMSKADLVCDQFGTSFPGMVATDAYALGRPVLANLRNDIFGDVFPEPLPGFNANSSSEITEHLLKFDNNSNLLVEKGIESRKYAEKYLSPIKMAEKLLARL